MVLLCRVLLSLPSSKVTLLKSLYSSRFRFCSRMMETSALRHHDNSLSLATPQNSNSDSNPEGECDGGLR